MNILVVIDQYDGANNGTTISARRFVDNLRKDGNEVRVISTGKQDKDKYVVKELKLPPIANKIIKSQGMEFAKPNEEELRKAIEWAEVVHFYMPFLLSRKGLKICEELNKPRTTAFHVQPENITYTIGLGKKTKVNDQIYYLFRDKFFNRFNHIHCPSKLIADELSKHGYTAKLHVISNGIEADWVYNRAEKPEELKDKIVITMVGRLSAEKRQDLLIEASKKSKYSNKIQLVFAGNGPMKKQYTKMGEELANKPIMDFFEKEDLKKLLSYTDLYVHTSDAEIEAISCIEAIATGLVPVIAKSTQSATKQFALDERSLFEAGNTEELKNKIDYWLDNAEEKQKMEKEYAKFAENFKIENSIHKMEEMFREEIAERKA